MTLPALSLRQRWLLVWGTAAAFFIALASLTLAFLYDQAIARGADLAKSYALVLAEQTSQVFDATDQRLMLTQLRFQQLKSQGLLNESTAMDALHEQLKGQPYLVDAWLLDRFGRIVYDTHPGTAGINLSDRPFYAVHITQPETRFFVDTPVMSRRTGQWQLSVSRPWRSANGVLEGVLVAAVNISYFEKIWRTADLGAGGSVSLLNTDGLMLMRSPFVASAVGSSYKHRPLFTQYLPQAASGIYDDHSSVDFIRRLFAYRTVGVDSAMVLVLGLSYDSLLEPWTQLAWTVATILLVSIGAMGWLVRALRQSWSRTRYSEKKAQVSDHALAAIAQGVLIATADRRTLSVNPAFEALTGYHESELVGRPCSLLQGPDTNAATVVEMREALQAQKSFAGELLNYRKDGSPFWNEISISPVFDGHGVLTHFVGVQSDITERKAQQMQLRLTEQVFNQAREGITITDAQGNIIRINSAFTAITGYADYEVMGKNPRVLASGLQDRAFYEAMWSAILTQGVWSGEIYNRHKDGTVHPEWLTISVIRDADGNITHFLGSFSDLSQVRAAENRVQKLRHFDPLTGLPNRTLLQDRTAHAISMVQRSKDTLCMMLVSIDHFKVLNETLGHSVGDTVLVEVARRLSESLRDQDTVSHHAGKEFNLILPGTPTDGAAHLASELLWKLAQPYVHANQQISITASIGVSTFPDNGNDFDSLYKSAEIALHRAQAGGRDNFKFYSEGMYEEVLARDNMTKALRVAAQRGELQVLYQPLGDLQTGKISGMEALLRWHHPELGTVSPVVFIPIAEETGLIRSIGEWVLRQVCTDLRTWLDQGLDAPHVAVNVSPIQFRDPTFIAMVQAALSDKGVEASRIHLEVTESALMDDVQRCEDILRALKKLGFLLSLDDFGTGYSSLSYLKRYPFDKVKIDQSFVRDISTSQTDSVIVKVIISMAHGLGLKVIAEGVETETQCEIMRTNVCDEIQGYFFSRPVDADTLKGLLQDKKQLPPHLLRFRPKQRTLLLVDDEPNVLAAPKRLFRRDGHTIVTADSGAQGLEVLAQQKVDVIISDQRMPGMTGVEFLREAKLKYPDTIRIVLSGYTELQSVTDAINEGAIYRFLTKPWDDEQLREQIKKAFEHQELFEENQQLDIKIRTTNQELVAANRHLGEVINSTRQQIEVNSASLAIVREALQFIPTPVLGLDDDQVVIFANAAAELLLAQACLLLGVELVHVCPELVSVINRTQEGQTGLLQLGATVFDVCWNTMGQHSRSRGRLLTLSPRVLVS